MSGRGRGLASTMHAHVGQPARMQASPLAFFQPCLATRRTAHPSKLQSFCFHLLPRCPAGLECLPHSQCVLVLLLYLHHPARRPPHLSACSSPAAVPFAAAAAAAVPLSAAVALACRWACPWCSGAWSSPVAWKMKCKPTKMLREEGRRGQTALARGRERKREGGRCALPSCRHQQPQHSAAQAHMGFQTTR